MGLEFTDKEWELIVPLLPNKPRGVPRTDDRRVLNGIFFILRTGTPWRDMPERYGPYTTAYNRYNRWAKAGVWLKVFDALAEHFPQTIQGIDSAVILAHRQAAAPPASAPTAVPARSRFLFGQSRPVRRF